MSGQKKISSFFTKRARREEGDQAEAEQPAAATADDRAEAGGEQWTAAAPERTPAHTLDIGNFLRKDLNSVQEKHELLTKCWEPDSSFKFPVKEQGKKNRKFVHGWLSRFPWLRYSQKFDAGFCVCCMIFGKESGEGKGTKTFKIIKTIDLCARQNFPLRGKDDSGPVYSETGQRNPGNFRALLLHQMEYDPELKVYIESAGLNAQYTSPRIQNELITLCGNFVQEKVLENVKKSRFFSVLVDEATDVSMDEQLALLLRYTARDESENAVLKEDFVHFLKVDDLTGKGLAATIMNSLKSAGLDLNFLIGQGYDGAANMAGRHKGVQAEIQRQCPLAAYTHCASHSLNLVCVHACKLPEIQNCCAHVQKIIFFFTYSAQRTEVLKAKIRQLPGLSDRKNRLIEFCETRWVDRHRAFLRFEELFQAIVLALDELAENQSVSRDTRSNADAFSDKLRQFSFLVDLLILSKVSAVMKDVSILLQDKQMDLVACISEIDRVKSKLQEYIDEPEHFRSIFEKAQLVATGLSFAVKVPRRTAQSNLSPCEFYRENHFLPFLRTMIEQLNQRFSEHQRKIFALQALIPAKLGCVSYTVLESAMLPFCNNFLDVSREEIQMEVEKWTDFWKNRPLGSAPCLPSTVLESYNFCCRSEFYPIIRMVLQIFATLPVTTASAERSFSAMRRIKSFLRSSMSEERFTGLSQMNIHREINIDPEEIVQSFTRKKRRLLFTV